jgi:formylglycine-generating enzyme required for sulfatase activity
MQSCARALAVSVVVFLLGFGLAPSSSAAPIVWAPIGSPGNAADVTTGYGAVGYSYSVSTYEVTNAQYVDFLNAKAAADPLGLYNPFMGATSQGGIARTGVSGSYTYATISGRADRPVDFVSFYDTLRFANWMTNGGGTGDTETGAYTLLGGTASPSNGLTVTRNAGNSYFVTSEDEWYKAAYYDTTSSSYYAFTTSSNVLPTCSAPTATANRGNCGNAAGGVPTIVGSYTGSASPNGTFDQGGNLWEWNEAIVNDVFNSPAYRAIRGGAYGNFNFRFAAADRENTTPSLEFADVGFRMSFIPEPGTGLLLGLGLIGMAVRKRLAVR